MLNKLFPHVFLISLPESERLPQAASELEKVGMQFTHWPAIDGEKAGLKTELKQGLSTEFWNPAAAGLVLTTAQIIRYAMENNLPHVVILEDDVVFADDLEDQLQEHISFLPQDWQMLYLGSQICFPPDKIERSLYRIKMAYCHHAYVVRETIYQQYLDLLEKCDEPADWATAHHLQQKGTTYGFHPNLAWQRNGYSCIQKKEVSREYLKPGAINYVYSSGFRPDLFPKG